MPQILIAAIGRMRDKAELALARTYIERIRPVPRIIEIEIATNTHRPAADVKKIEGEKLLSILPVNRTCIVLDEKGMVCTSVEFARKFAKWQERGHSLAFLIGGADGHAPAVKSAANDLLSLGAMTWPHKLARIMLLEQIYRAQQILAGHPYHRS